MHNLVYYVIGLICDNLISLYDNSDRVCHGIFCPGLNFVLGQNIAGILLSGVAGFCPIAESL